MTRISSVEIISAPGILDPCLAKPVEDVGFYYASNAVGRLVGILLSGTLTQLGGLAACLWGSTAMLALCLVIAFLLPVFAAPRHQPA